MKNFVRPLLLGAPLGAIDIVRTQRRGEGGSAKCVQMRARGEGGSAKCVCTHFGL